MARVPAITREQLNAEDQPIYDEIAAARGGARGSVPYSPPRPKASRPGGRHQLIRAVRERPAQCPQGGGDPGHGPRDGCPVRVHRSRSIGTRGRGLGGDHSRHRTLARPPRNFPGTKRLWCAIPRRFSGITRSQMPYLTPSRTASASNGQSS